MGLENNTNAIYLTISNGKICRQLHQKSENSKERVNKNGKIVQEEFYDKISGVLTNITKREVEIAGQQMCFWQLAIEDDGKIYQLQFQFSSGYANGFLKTIQNANLTQRMTLIPHLKEENGKKKTTLFINQNGTALKHYYTRENPNGLPQLEKKTYKGKDVWDDTLMMKFFEEMINTKIKPLLKGSKLPEPVMADVVEDDANDGPLPF